MLDALKKIDSIDKPNKKGRVIIHVDTHSDLMRSRIKRESIADFLNTVLAQGQCSEIYWVLPDWTKDSKVKDTFWNNNSYKLLFLDDKTEDTFYVKNGNVFFTKPEDLDGSYKTVKFHKVTIDDLPSFAAKKNVQLDIDSDYFSNTGFDTAGEVLANNNPSTTELSENLQTFTRKLEDKGINPEIVTLARSPNYTSPEDLPVIEAYFKGIYGNSAITELALHGWDKESDMYLLAELYNSVQDSPTKKMQNPNFQDLDNMLVRNPFEFVKMAKENPTKLLKERGFPELLEFYETYKNNPDATNKNKLLTAIEDTLALLNKRIYPSNNI